MNIFWKKWLNFWAVGVTIFGLTLAAAAFAPTDGPARALFALFGTPMPDSPDALHRFAVGLMGAVTMGWGLTFGIAFSAIWSLGESAGHDHTRPYWRSVLVATLIWYGVDGFISIATGYWMNAVSNTVLLLLLLVPLIRGGLIRGRGQA